MQWLGTWTWWVFPAYKSSKTTMFKSAATKLAHSSAIRAVAPGNSDLRPLQEIITTEKVVLQSYVHPATLIIPIPTSHFQSTETQHGLWQVYRRSAYVGRR